MSPRSNAPNKTTPREAILAIGADAPFRRALAREIESLARPTLVARSLAEAVASATDFEPAPSAVLVPESAIDTDRFESDLAELRVRSGADRLTPIAYGRAPSEARRRALRDIGIDLALFGRFGRHALRFQINRALAADPARAIRGECRAPQEWRTTTFSSGREKSARCYSLSSTGAYLVTPRPWVVGSDVALELPIARDRLLIPGRILYTHQADTGDRPGLPRGMAVAFGPLSAHLQEVIRQDVTAAHEALQV